MATKTTPETAKGKPEANATVTEAVVESKGKADAKPTEAKKAKRTPLPYSEIMGDVWNVIGDKKGNYSCADEKAVAKERPGILKGMKAIVKQQWAKFGLTKEACKGIVDDWTKVLAKTGGQHPKARQVSSVLGFHSFSAFAQAKADAHIANPASGKNQDKGAIRHFLISLELYPEAKKGRSAWVAPESKINAARLEYGLKPITVGVADE